MTEEAGESSDGDPDRRRKGHRRQDHDQIESGDDDDTREHVFSVLVGAEWVRERWRQCRVAEVHPVRVVRSQNWAQQRREKDQRDYEESSEGGRVASELVDEIAEAHALRFEPGGVGVRQVIADDVEHFLIDAQSGYAREQ